MNPQVSIRYRRPPDRERTFHQMVLEEHPSCVVTLLDAAPIDAPVRAGGGEVLQPGAPVVWFTYPGLWHDVGRFHLRDGTFTGWYANVLTPVEMQGAEWETTDLFLDVWCGADGQVEILDEDEFRHACASGWLDPETARRARLEADALAERARAGSWPDRLAREWRYAPVLP